MGRMGLISPLGAGFSPRMWPRINHKMESLNEKIDISARCWFFSKDVAADQPQDRVFERKDLFTLLSVQAV